MPKIELTDGSPVPTDGSHKEIDPRTGQQKGYIVLSPEERAKGFVKPVRRSYTHNKCGGVTTVGRALAETYARDPYFYSGTFCCNCGTHFPLAQFDWEDGEPMDTSLQEEWQRTEGERRRKARHAALQNRVAQLRSDLEQAERELASESEDASHE